MLATIALALAVTSVALEPVGDAVPTVAVEAVLLSPKHVGALHELGVKPADFAKDRLALTAGKAEACFRHANYPEGRAPLRLMALGDVVTLDRAPASSFHAEPAQRDVALELQLADSGLHVRVRAEGDVVLEAVVEPSTEGATALRLPDKHAEPTYLVVKATALPVMPEVERLARDYVGISTYFARWRRSESDFFPAGEATLAFSRDPLRVCIVRREEGSSPSAQVWVYAEGVLRHAVQSDVSLGATTTPMAVAEDADALRLRTQYLCPDLHLLLGVRPWYPRDPRVDDFTGGGFGSMSLTEGHARELRVVTTRRVRPGQSLAFRFDGEPLRVVGYEHRVANDDERVPDRVAAWELVELRVNEPLPTDAFDLRRQRMGLTTALAAGW